MTRLALAASILFFLGCDRPVASTTPVASATRPPESVAPEAEAAPEPVPPPSTAIASTGATLLTFDGDTPDAPPTGIEPVVGDWSISERDGVRGLLVDGSRWRSGEASASIVDQARRLYGERYGEFLDGVRAFAFFPLAVATAEPPAGDVRVSVRFFAISGRIDQAAGIAFGIGSDGSYQGVRANALEDNLLYFHVERGRRTVVDTIRGVETSTRAWHTLSLELRGVHAHVELDGTGVFDRDLDARPVGRVGLWSKADSEVLFDDFRVEPL